MPGESEYVSLSCPRCGAALTSGASELTCAYCGARLILRRAARSAAPPAAPDVVQVAEISLGWHVFQDAQSAMPAFRMRVPEGWTVEGGVIWTPAHPSAPVNSHVRVIAPDGVDAFEFLPTQYFSWVNSAMGMMLPPGAMNYGEEVRQPTEARQAVMQYLLPRCRNVPGVAVESVDLAPDWAAHTDRVEPLPPGLEARRDGVRAFLRYTAAEQPVREEICATVDVVRIAQQMGWSPVEFYSWSIRQVAARRHAPDRFDAMAPVAGAILSSIETNPQWQATVRQVTQQLTQGAIQATNRAGEAAREIGRTLSETSDMITEGWWRRQETMDRVADNFSQTIRGVDAYQDPTSGRRVELPGGYRQAWTNGLGEYILSEEAGFDPNVGSTVSWTPLTRD